MTTPRPDEYQEAAAAVEPMGQDMPAEDEVYVFPMSYAQQRIWFLDQFQPGSAFYNIPTAMRLTGRLDVDALRRAVNEIVRRHEALRTVFRSVHGEPSQIILPRLTIDVPLISLEGLPAEEREAAALRLARDEARKPFDLARGPLLRFSLLRLAEDDHVALVTMHHIVSDGWSVSVFVRELSILYAAFSRGLPSPLPELPIQYADFAEWQREWLQGEVLERQYAYWERQLKGPVPIVELPGDRPRPPVQTANGATLHAKFPRALLDRLHALSRQEGATLFMTLLAAFKVLLHRYTGLADLPVGTPIANRTRAELEPLIGVFINTLVLRTRFEDLGGEITFRELLRRVRQVALEAYEHQDLPFEMLVDRLQPERDMSHPTLFQTMFILQNAGLPAQEAPGLSLKVINVDAGTATFDLTLSLAEQVDGLSVAAEYNTDLFDRSTIERLLGHYQTLLEGIVADPDRAIGRLPMLTDAERQLVLYQWNRTQADYDTERCIHQLFEAQAAATPDAVAVVVHSLRSDDFSRHPAGQTTSRRYITYRELDERANQLAHHLRGLGVGPETIVAVLAEKSVEMIVALLGILKAGGAYLPIDPSYPTDRILHMLTDSGARVVVSTKESVLRNSVLRDSVVRSSVVPGESAAEPTDTEYAIRNTDYALRSTQYVLLDRDWPEIARQPASPIPDSRFQIPDSLAYVIYTSGSTGQSKGVMVEHRSIVNAYLAWERAYALREPVKTHLQMASFSFDVFTGDLVRALCSGGTLVLCPRELLLEPAELYALMRREGVTCAEFVPAVLRGLVQYLEETGQDLSFMQVLACGSDSWFVGEYRRFLKFCGPNTRLINSFGLTEATIDTCYFEARPGDPNLARLALDQIVPIGAPFANQTMVILDRYGEPTPIGVPGELYVGGLGVARGYLNRPDLTAERFVPNPFVEETRRHGDTETERGSLSPRLRVSASRLYRTGDLARWLPDGNVQFLGRADDQVKIRGYRIEPGEIEAVFDRHPDLAGCAVVARPDPKGQNRLVAYYVVRRGLSDDAAPSAGELRRFAQERLPDYMVPSLFVRLEAMSLTPNGKVDRNGLPAPDWSQRAAEEAYVPPRTPLERQVADIWAEVLSVERVGAFDNFFELGGHSLLATQLVSRLRKAFDIDLPLRHIFESPTVAALSEQIEAALRRAAAPAAPAALPLAPLPRDPATGVPAGPLPLSFAQQRLWFLDQLEPDSPLYNIPESVRLTGPLDVDLLRRALNALVQRHESLRTSFVAVDGVPGQVIAPRLTVDLPVEDISGLPPAEREAAVMRLAAEEAQRPFKLSRPPLMRARLLRLAEQDHVFLLTTHHIISDNWSSNVLVREMAAVYDALRRGQPPEAVLPPLPIQYADFAAWQRAWLQGEALDAQLGYWRQKLAGAPPLLELPTDRPRPPVQTFRGAYQTFRLSRELSAALRRLTQDEGATLFMTLLAAFQTWLNRYAGQDDICVGTPIANRTRAELEGIVGFFVNTLVMRGDLTGDPTFRELLRRTRATALEAYAHQDVPFEMVVDAVQPQRNLAHSPLFQVMFALQSSQAGAPALRPQATGDGLTIAPVEAHSGTAKFDLTLFMTEEGDRLAGALEYNTDLFDHSTIERMLGHFQTLLAGIAADPDRRLSRLPLLTEAEERYLLVEWNATAADFPEHLLAHQLIEQQAAATPDAVAVVGRSARGRREREEREELEELGELEGLEFLQVPPSSSEDGSELEDLEELQELEELTYAELDRRANQLAHHLRSLGVGPGEVVAICTERVVELPVAMLAVLKAGAAYLPIDPSYPAERIAYMLEDSGARVVITQENVLRNSVVRGETAAEPTATDYAIRNTQYVLLDRDWPQIARQPTFHIPHSTFHIPDAPAYLIYTSGSTGRPKGTLVHHRGLVNYLTWCRQAYPLDRGIGAPVHSSISFDLTVTSLLAPLTTGKAAFLVPDDLGIEALTETLLAYGDFSLVKITPAHLELIGRQLRPDEAAGRTHAFIIGGEQLLAEHVAFWQRHAPDTLLVNEYGPTETVVGCAVFTADGRTPLHGPVPIGRPIINTRLYVLDRHLNLLPVGVPGELYIGGVGVAHGYLNRPDLTAERFLPDPFAVETRRHGDTETERISPSPRLHVSASRLYRTGDLVRLRPDGVLEFLGRVDNQVKIRGFRVELGEIEAVLAQHPAVQEAAVLVHEPAPGDKRLVAYISLRTPLRSDGFPGQAARTGSRPVTAEAVTTKESAPLRSDGFPGQAARTGSRPEAAARPDGRTDEAVTTTELRQFLGRTLPDYMIPAAFVVLPSLPLNPNGKVDRKALARMEGVRLEAGGDGAGFVAPATATEEILANLWADLLGVERVSAADSFFDLGGHSLLATQLMSRIQAAFGVELPLRTLFEAPVLSDLAAAIDRAAAEGRQLAAPPLTPLPRGEDGRPLQPPPLSFGQQRFWFLDKLEPGNPFYNIPSAVRLSGPLNVEALVQALNDVVRRHEVLRTAFAEADGKPVAVVHPVLRLDLPLTDLSNLPEAEQGAELHRLYAEEATAPFDLARGPLLRGRIVRLADEEHVLLLTMHHIVSDAWSNGVLVAELAEGYAARLEGRPAHLPPLPVQYADFAAWQRAWLEGGAPETSPLQRQLAYWREQLAGLPPLLELPTDRPRPPVQTYRGDRRTFRLSPELSQALHALARREGVTPFMALLAAFQALLHRYTGQDAIPVGTPIAGRTRREVEPLIGFFINTLVLRGDLGDNPTFRELLRRTRETALAAYAHQDVPFETVVDHLGVERSLSYSPVFQVMFVLQNAAQSAARGAGGRGPTALASGLRIAALDMPTTSSPFDMTLSMAEDADGFAGAWEFNPDLFDGETIERMIGHFETLLAAAVADPDRRVGDLPLLTEAELAQRAAWNATARPEFLGRTVVELFEAQAQRTPDKTAVVMVGRKTREKRELGELGELEELTYAELDARANQLAHHLRGLGVGPETIVGLMVERSPEMIVGLLGILKAGGAYLPIDPNYPAERIAYMLEDSGVRVLVTQKRLIERIGGESVTSNDVMRNRSREERAAGAEGSTDSDEILDPVSSADDHPVTTEVVTTKGEAPSSEVPLPSPGYGLRITHYVFLDHDWPEIAQHPPTYPSTNLPTPDNLAYIIYTSGTTGRPKGVMIHHEGLANLVQSQTAAFEVDERCRVLQFASLSFDAAASEIFMALTTGAALYLAPQEVLASLPDLAALFRREGITTVTLPPSVLALLSPEEMGGLHTLITAGERCGADVATRWMRWAQQPVEPGRRPRRFINAYGPTETSIGPTLGVVTDLPVGAASAPVGTPIPNIQIHILDRYGHPVPVGVPGELYVGGVGVGRGYLNRPDLTAERFVPDPFVDCKLRIADCGLRDEPTTIRNPKSEIRNSLRLYRTGDLARYLPDGRIEILGRVDQQVKLRGFRIELGEIEAALREHPQVLDAAAVVQTPSPGVQRLVAFVTLRSDGLPGQAARTGSRPEAAARPDGRTGEAATTKDARTLRSEGFSPPSLRDFLRQRLPDYMVPAAIVPLDALPLTPNGKVDRRRLASWDIAAFEAEAERVPPRTPTEEVLAALWADLLAASRVGATDNFFALGGHSLLATQLVSRIRDAFGVELPLRALFEAPTLADLARAVDAAQQARRGSAAPPLTPMPRDPANDGLPAVRPPLSFAQQRLWFLDRLEPDSPLYNLPVAVRLIGRLDVDALRRSLVALVQRHEALRTTFADEDGEAYQVIAPASAAEALVVLPVDDLSALPETEREAAARRLAVAEARRPFDLAAGPLLRCRLLRLAEEEHVVLLTMHHIVGDGWSVGVLIRELAALYAAFAEGALPALPDLRVQYADYAYWQRGWLQGEALEAQLDYWRQELAGLPPLLELPTDRPRPPIPSYRGDTVEFTLPPELTAALKDLSRREGATLFMTLLAALQTLLHRYSGQDDIAVGTPIAGRTQRETEGLIGFFVNTLVLRGRLGDNPTFRELLRRTRETALEAYAHQDLPFETLVDALAPVRDMSHSPLFQVVFTMQNQPMAGMGLPGLRLEPIQADAGVAKFDLTLSVVEDAAGGLSAALEYATDLFDRDTVERMAGHLRTLLEAIAADPDRRIGELPLLTPAETQQILVDWTATDAPFPADRTVVDLFEEWVARAPDTTAVVMVGRRERKEKRERKELGELGELGKLGKRRGSKFRRVPPSSSEDAASEFLRVPPSSSEQATPEFLQVLPSSSEETETLTYAELDARANQLAHHLRGLGVGPETIVGLMVERSPEMIVGLLGILKAGGAYLPIDPNYPAERIAYMLEDSGVRVLVTQKRLIERIGGENVTSNGVTRNRSREERAAGAEGSTDSDEILDLASDHPVTTEVVTTKGDAPSSEVPLPSPGYGLRIAHYVFLDHDWPEIAQHPPTYPSTNLPAPDNLVYIIYTSGSTGKPKGVMVAHRGLTNLVTAQIKGFRVPPGSRVLQFASVSFDAAASEIFMALAGGSTLVLAPQAVLSSVPDLATLLATQRISVVTLPPSVLSVLPTEGLEGLTSLISAGERCPADLARRWAVGRHFVNAYGPTEATIGPTMCPVTDLPEGLSSAPIGRPIPNMRLYLLDRYGQPVPVGVPGEIYIGGVGVARGYLNRPDLTAERFVPDPFAVETRGHGDTETERVSPSPRLRVSASRLYRTGDLARWLPDGNIEYLGRADFQVKVRGFRIELGEIETVLREHPAVAEAAVLAKETADGDRRLVAYVALTPALSQGERGVDVAGLREHLRRRLPEYMVPAVFVPLEAMPLTPNGKVDRRALAAMAEPGRTATADYVEPRTDAERRLAQVWAQVLGVQRVGVHDNFFDLGGDSILSLRLIARARQAGFHLTPRQLFERPTIAGLLAEPSVAPATAAAEEAAETGPLPLTPVQRWFFDHHPLAPHHFNTSMLRTVWGQLDLPRLEQALNALVAHHDALRLRFRRTADGWQAEVAESASLSLERFDLSATPAEERSAALEAIAARLQAGFDLAQPPLARLAYFDIGADQPGRLLLIFHHLVADGVSWRILLEDLATAYAQLSQGQPVRLPARTTSLRTWATRLAAYAQSEAARAELPFWRSLADAKVKPASLPVDFPGGRNTYGSTDELTVALSEAETTALLRAAPAHFRASIHAVLLAALARGLAPWTGSRRLWVETEGHGREEVLPGMDLSRTVGWFTSIYPVLVDLGDGDDAAADVERVDATLRRIPARGVGYGILRYLSDDPAVRQALARLPQPPINFNYLGQFQEGATGESGSLLLGPAPEGSGPEQHSDEERSAQLYVVGIVTGGALRLRWLYSRNLHRRETVQRLAEATLAELRRIVRTTPKHLSQ